MAEPKINRNELFARIGKKMQDSANTYRTIGCPAVFEWGDLIIALTHFSDGALRANKARFSEFLHDGEWPVTA